jgi:hypothetical protein
MTTLHRAIALQGIGYRRADIATQGYRFLDKTPSPPALPAIIRFAPYIQATVKRVYARGSVNICRVQALRIFSLVDLVIDSRAFVAINTIIHIYPMTDFYIKKGDTLPRIESLLRYSDGRAVNLKDAIAVQFVYRPVNGGIAIFKNGVIIDAIQGKVGYQWVTGDTAIPGDYVAEWRITFSDNGQLTIPNNETFIEFTISPTL